ncbi:hypothetical protein GGH91_000897 [Coemansia sp. RSA 2671]|uniref:Uncharacterized protein n=1 Tax=Coemansia linderi TaxID=2663919 RepID=A0ACC1KKS8_9FUNG|nr:hypothetical protein LPJ60_001584 [Coemansia sp. RSA 2675]KAJ1996552.1 hypothetical protein GGI06_006730 [Coemansia sp. S85]KAJ2349291.1 hypothetical protein GGH91_000897 [Coemansia sp. RSA 2671]KAJ2364786.1 hypothetical protein H4S02_010810 [Coemansia sp. RSA 2611]KAJ2413704.1 hypothetical protein GGI10_002883 [Coemansia sp. RSA 2530]KAJ2695081.1 hypothetical protein H4218_005352 [Coemansia sp. IMI 209128]KAJ2791165.1 hypothetical protein GGI18_001333 [Coemansia linderi]
MASGNKVYADFTSLVGKPSRGSKSVVDPFGYDQAIASGSVSSMSLAHGKTDEEGDMALRAKKAWEVAMGPGKTLPMQAFMAWMSGTGVSIFSILITGMILMTPVKTIMSTQQTFAPLERAGKSAKKLDLTMQKAAFVAINIAGLIFGVYRLSLMGLLPTASSDWLSFIPAKQYMEFSA